MSKTKPDHPIEEVVRMFTYDQSTGIVTRRVSAGNRKAGSHVGRRNDFGHLVFELGGKSTGVHRLAFALYHGRWPVGDIDHINRDPSDNRLSNLREATVSQNIANSRLYKSNKTGFRGVSTARNGTKFRARIRVDGVLIYLGEYESANEASEAYKNAALNHFGRFANVD